MGLLSLGTPLNWDESKKYNEHVRTNGITQLINIFNQHQHRKHDKFLWGDEVEYMLIDVNDRDHTARLAIDKDYIINDLNDPEKLLPLADEKNVSYHPEYGRFMIESTPARPYDGNSISDYLYVEKNMVTRREICQDNLPREIRLLTFTSFPRMGCNVFTSPPAKPNGVASQSLFLPDEIINRHVRFPTLTANIRKRKGHKVSINLPMYPDKYTKLLDDSIPANRDYFDSDKEPWIGASKPGYVYMDSMGFGMGSSCLQITMQAQHIEEARYLYDSLAPIAPIMLSLSAATPIFKGFLVDQDVRWNVVSGAVDDRTFIEKGQEPYTNYHLFGGLDIDANDDLKINNHQINQQGDLFELYTKDGKPIQRVPKSRYDSVDNYLNDSGYDTKYYQDSYNDLNAPINEKVYKRLIEEGGLDSSLANHFAHLFIRDPLVIFSERIDQDNTLENDHFENIQSTNWQTLRFKPPALYDPKDTDLSSKPGWRVEFRPMEIQLTDFENAAYSTFITLLSKAILKFKPNFYIPLSKVEINMKLAHKVDSVLNDKFWFKSFESWNLKAHDFDNYGLEWFDKFINNTVVNHTENHTNGHTNGVNGFVNGSIPVKGCQGKTVEEINDVDDNGINQRYSICNIINGKDNFPGLIKLVIKLIATDLVPESLSSSSSSTVSRDELVQYLTRLKAYLWLISSRASGEIPTTAHWLRHKVINHELYQHDSKVSEEINYDLVKDSISITELEDRLLIESFLGKDLTAYLYESK
ncbi:GCS1 Glutamate--cysteine ligase [Candida maltosa Xu316]